MVEGRGEFEWQMTASLMALHINMNRKKGAKAVKPNDFNPFSFEQAKHTPTITGKAAWDMFRQAFDPAKK